MSEMNLDVVVRVPVHSPNDAWDYDNARNFCSVFIEPVEYGGDFEFETHRGFTFSYFGDRLYLDYYITDGLIEYDFDVNVSLSMLDEFIDSFNELWKEERDLIELVAFDEWKVKVLYYYNGGCAGAREIE